MVLVINGDKGVANCRVFSLIEKRQMMNTKPIEKHLGMRCIACLNFSHKAFSTLQERLAYGRREHGGTTFGRCNAIDADDQVGCHSVKHESQNPDCRFVSAGLV